MVELKLATVEDIACELIERNTPFVLIVAGDRDGGSDGLRAFAAATCREELLKLIDLARGGLNERTG